MKLLSELAHGHSDHSDPDPSSVIVESGFNGFKKIAKVIVKCYLILGSPRLKTPQPPSQS